METFSEILARHYGDYILPQTVSICIPQAEQRLRAGLDYYVSHFSGGSETKAEWSERNYRPIVEWMSGNKGKGLLMTGSCGLGKSLIGIHILPVLMLDACRKRAYVCNAQRLNTKPNEVMENHIISIDDVGTEGVSNLYGNKRIPFMELCDLAERKGKLLIISTNLTVPELREKYGDRTVDRLRAITKFVPFTGKSLRK